MRPSNHIRKIKSLSKDDINKKLTRVQKLFIGLPVIRGEDGYPYSLFPLTDYKPAMRPEIVEDMADLLVYFGNFREVDIIVSEADRGGGPLTHAVSVRTNLPYTLANWYPRKIEREIVVRTKVGFSGDGFICLNGLIKGQKAIIVDDLLSSGGTAMALIEAIKKSGAILTQALFVGEKVNVGGRKRILAQYDVSLVSLVRFEATGDRTREL